MERRRVLPHHVLQLTGGRRQQAPDLGRQRVRARGVVVQVMAVATLAQAKSVPGRGVEVAHPGRVRCGQGGFALRIGCGLETIADRDAAQAQAGLRPVTPALLRGIAGQGLR